MKRGCLRGVPRSVPLRSVLALLCVFGCSQPPLTEIIFEIDSDFPTGELDMVRIEIQRGADLRSADVSLATQSFPFTQGIVHREGSLGPVSITVEGSYGGLSVIRQLRSTSFDVGRSNHVRVVLSPACVGVVCPDGFGCLAGECAGDVVEDAGVTDAAAAEDSGTSDAGLVTQIIEAESVTPEAPWRSSSLGAQVDPGVSANLDPNATPNGRNVGVIRFPFEGLRANQTHYVWLRYRSTNNGSNSVHVSTAGERAFVRVDVEARGGSGSSYRDPLEAASDSSGRLTVSLKNREVRFEIDAVLVTSDGVFDPR